MSLQLRELLHLSQMRLDRDSIILHQLITFNFSNHLLKIEIFVPEVVKLFLLLVKSVPILPRNLFEVSSLILVQLCHALFIPRLKHLHLGPH